jgi:hypothetical protein
MYWKMSGSCQRDLVDELVSAYVLKILSWEFARLRFRTLRWRTAGLAPVKNSRNRLVSCDFVRNFSLRPSRSGGKYFFMAKSRFPIMKWSFFWFWGAGGSLGESGMDFDVGLDARGTVGRVWGLELVKISRAVVVIKVTIVKVRWDGRIRFRGSGESGF